MFGMNFLHDTFHDTKHAVFEILILIVTVKPDTVIYACEVVSCSLPDILMTQFQMLLKMPRQSIHGKEEKENIPFI